MNAKLKEYLMSKGGKVSASLSISKDVASQVKQALRAQKLAANDAGEVPPPDVPLIPMTFGAEYYVERWYGILVVDFSPEAVDLSRWTAELGAPYFKDHDPTQQCGIILNGKLENKVLTGEVKFSANEDAQELLTDVLDQIRPYTSMGFDILGLDQILPEDMPEDLKNKCLEMNCDAYKVTKWRPYEGSSVPLGANPNVGVQYSEYAEGMEPEQVVKLAESFGMELPKTFKERFSHLFQKEHEAQPKISINQPTHQPKEDAMSRTKEQLEADKAALVKFGADYKDRVPGGLQAIETLANDVITLHPGEETESLERKFRGQLFLKVQDKEMREAPASLVGMSDKQKETYSIGRLIRAVTKTPVERTGKIEEAGFEMEVHQQILANGGKQSRGESILLPMDVMSKKLSFNAELNTLLAQYGIRTERFDQTVGSSSGGGYLVGTQHRAQDMVDIFLNAIIQGITYMPGLSQNVDIPKVTGGPTVDVATAEAAGFSETALTFGQILLSPKEIGAYIDVTRRLMVQSSPAVDNLITSLLLQQLALKINAYAIYGSGASGQPTGVVSTSGIGTFDGTSLGRAGVLNAESDIRGSNVRNPLQWLLSAVTQELLKNRDQSAGYANYLMKDDGSIIGYRSQVTEQMTANTLLLGDMSEIIVAGFGSPELVVDRSTAITNGGARIALFDMFDVGVKHPGAFSYASSVS